MRLPTVLISSTPFLGLIHLFWFPPLHLTFPSYSFPQSLSTARSPAVPGFLLLLCCNSSLTVTSNELLLIYWEPVHYLAYSSSKRVHGFF